MPKKTIANGRALFYSRDSEGRHETTPSQYIIWAQKRAQDLGVQFDGEPETIERMIREALDANGWTDDFKTGDEFATFIDEQDARVSGTLQELGLL